MAQVAIDTLKYAKKLESAGIPQEQAEAQAEALAEAIDINIATKQDLLNLKNELNQSIANVENKLSQVENELNQVEYRLTIKLGTFITLATGIILTVMHFMLH